MALGITPSFRSWQQRCSITFLWPAGLWLEGFWARNAATDWSLKMKEGLLADQDGAGSAGIEFGNYRPTAMPVALRLRKHSRQYTGRPCVGLKGTVVSRPHCEHMVMVSVLVKPPPEEPCRLTLQVLQRLGSFLKFLSWKKCCSPA